MTKKKKKKVLSELYLSCEIRVKSSGLKHPVKGIFTESRQ